MSKGSFFRRHLFIPLWALKDRSPRFSYMRELEKSQYYDVGYLKEKQFIRLKEILDHAYKHTKYYSKIFEEYGIYPKDIWDPKDFQKIPILSKKLVQNNCDDFITNYVKKSTLIPFKTGGSTGKSLTVYKDFQCMELEMGGALRSFKWAGWKIGELWGRVWGNPPDHRTLKEKLYNILINPQIFLDTMQLNDKTMLEFVAKWKKSKPTILQGHSHSIYIFAQFCKNQGINDIKPKGIISTSMMLIPHERKIIESVFGCKVTDMYGCEEVGLIGCECNQHNGIHLNVDNLYIEIINSQGNEASHGEQGVIVVTSLLNKAMPLIRYKIEDVGILSNRQCSCGRTLPLMDKVSGRVADFLVRKDGSLVAGVSLVERTLTNLPGINQMQIIQEDIENIAINLVKGKSYDNKTEEKLRRELKQSLGDDVKITIKFKEKIEQEPSGKYRFSISKVKNPYINI